MHVVLNSGPHGSLDDSLLSESLFRGQHLLLLDPRHSSELRQSLVEAIAQTPLAQTPLSACVWVATSGTMSALRLVALSFDALQCSSEAINRHLGVNPSDCWLTALPDFHVGGFMIQHRAYVSGVRFVRTVGNIAPWDPREYHKAAGDSQCTLSALVPTQLFDLVREELVCPASLRAIVIGGQALSEGLYRRARTLGWPVIPSYGMTEACSQVATASVTDISEGLPPILVLPHVELETERVPSEDVSDPAHGESGIIKIRSNALLSGYLEAVNGEYVFRNPLEGGWFTTADLGIVDSGVLTVLGRVGDVVKIGGEHVRRSALEDALSETLLALRESNDFCIDFAKDERLGFAVELFALDLKRGELVSQYFNRLVHPAGRIRNVRVVTSIPRTGLGKVARTLLQTISSEEMHGKQKYDKQN